MSDPPMMMTLNGQAVSWEQACRTLRPMMSPQAITVAGGLLLKAAVADGRLVLNVEPNFIDGQRVYHYNMALPREAGPVLAGGVNPSGSVAVLFGPEATGAPAALLRQACVLLARALVEGGLDGAVQLTGVCRQGLEEVGAFATPPRTIGQLAAGDPEHP